MAPFHAGFYGAMGFGVILGTMKVKGSKLDQTLKALLIFLPKNTHRLILSWLYVLFITTATALVSSEVYPPVSVVTALLLGYSAGKAAGDLTTWGGEGPTDGS